MTTETKTPDSRASIALNDLLTRLAPDQKTILNLGEPGKDVTISLQKLPPPEPKLLPRLESQARDHDFFEARGFAAYLVRYGKENDLVVYANPSKEEMHATLEESAAGGRETVRFAPQLHPLWKPWHELIAKGKIPLDDFRQFLSVNRRAIRMPDGRGLALLLNQLRGAVKIDIMSGKGMKALNGIMVETSIVGVTDKQAVELPEEITLHAPLYVGGDPQDIEIDLLLEPDSRGGISVMLGASGVQEARVFAFDAMCADIRKTLETKKATVTYGEPSEKGWSYIGRDGATPSD